MKKIFFFIAAMVVVMTANAAVVNAHPNGGEAGVLSWFLGQVNEGDTLIMADGEYNQPSSLSFNKEGLVVMAAEGAKPVIALNDEGGWTTMKVDASTTFDGITFDGKGVAKYPAYINGTAVKKATFVNCEFKNYVKYAISDPYGGGTHVDSLIVNNCYFHDGGEAVYISKYGLDGQHGCNYCEITNSTLYNLTTSDYAGMIHVSSCNEATGAQNEVVIDHVTLYNYTGSSLGGIAIRKSSNLKISNSIIANPSDKTGFYAFYIYGGTIDNTLYYNTNDDADATHTACLTVDPLFVDAANGNLALAEGSPALTAGTDGKAIGDPRWAPVVEEPVEPEATWTVAGSPAALFGTEWDPANTANDMNKQEDGTYKWEKTDVELAASSIEFKVAKNHAWTEAYPGSNYKLAIAESGKYTITITFNAETKEVNAVATLQEVVEIIPTIAIAGDMNGWNTTANEFVMAEDKLTATLALTLEAKDYGFKMIIAGGWTSDAATITRENNSATFVNNGDNSTLVADVAGEYTFTWTYATNTLTVTYPVVSEPEYEIYEVEIKDLAIDLDNLALIGSANGQFQVAVNLFLGEYNRNEDTYQLFPESYVEINGSEATFVEGYASVNTFDQTATAVVRCVWNGMNIELHLNMSAAPLEATVVVVENAVIEIEKYLLFGDMYDYALKMTGVWVNPEDGLTYPVLVEVPVYYPEATEPSEITSTVTVGGWGDEDPWLGFGEGTLTITTVDDVITATGVVQNPMLGIAIDITISGTITPSGVENATVTINPVKMIQNGQLIIIKNDVQYNAQGAVVK